MRPRPNFLFVVAPLMLVPARQHSSARQPQNQANSTQRSAPTRPDKYGVLVSCFMRRGLPRIDKTHHQLAFSIVGAKANDVVDRIR